MPRADLLTSSDTQGIICVSGAVLNLSTEIPQVTVRDVLKGAGGAVLVLGVTGCGTGAVAVATETSNPPAIVSPVPKDTTTPGVEATTTPAYVPASTKEAPTAIASPLSDYAGLYLGVGPSGESTFGISGKDFKKVVPETTCMIPNVNGAYESQHQVFFDPKRSTELAAAIGIKQSWFLQVLNQMEGVQNARLENGMAVAEDSKGNSLNFNTIIKSEAGKPFGIPVICFANGGNVTLNNLRIAIWDDRAKALVPNTEPESAVISPAVLAAQSGLSPSEAAKVTQIEFDQQSGRYILMDKDGNDLAAMDAMGASKTEVFIQGLTEKNVGVPDAQFVESLKNDPAYLSALEITPDQVNIGYTDRKNDGTPLMDINNNPFIIAVDQSTGVPRAILVKDKETGEWGEWRNIRPGDDEKTIGISYGYGNEPKVREAAKLFNSTLINWEMRWKFNEKVQGKLDFNDPQDYAVPDGEVAKALEAGQQVTGLSLIDWNTYPDWLVKGINEKTFTQEQVKDMVKNRIIKTMDRYKGKINTWVVVNEYHPISLGWHDDALQTAMGDYTEFAFQTARDEANRIEQETGQKVVLLYNDNGNERAQQSNADRDFELVQTLHDKGLIDGVGMQMHIMQFDDHFPTYDEVKSQIDRYKAIGVPVFITEFDINLHNIKGTDEELKRVGVDPGTVSKDILSRRNIIQAEIMKNVLKAALDSDNVDYISFFGLGDHHSWLNEFYGYTDADTSLFDKDMKPKRMYYELLKLLFDIVE